MFLQIFGTDTPFKLQKPDGFNNPCCVPVKQESFQDRLSRIMQQLNDIEARLNKIHVELFRISVILLSIEDKLNNLIKPGQDCGVFQRAQTLNAELVTVKKIVTKSNDLSREQKTLTYYVARGELKVLPAEELELRQEIVQKEALNFNALRKQRNVETLFLNEKQLRSQITQNMLKNFGIIERNALQKQEEQDRDNINQSVLTHLRACFLIIYLF